MEARPKRANEIWLTEEETENLRLSLRISDVLLNERTPYQDLLVVRTQEYGNVMVLDGAIQLTERDEFCYHEMMVHVPLCAHPRPERVLIVGGGDGGCLREVLRHPNVAKATLIDIDEQVIEAARRFFPSVSVAMDDPRAEILSMDALDYVKDHRNEFDLVVVDSTDPVDFAVGLFESAFYEDVRRALKEEGMVTAQTESPFSDTAVVKNAFEAMKKVFLKAFLYVGFVPTYPTGFWTYTIGSKAHDPRKPLRVAPEGTRYYSSEVHAAAFALPPFLRQLIGDL